ncbi:L-rhamnose mutarotase [Ulvibacterium marinum]|uniref:L-rhamnose mutarotase n=1 Tax=Ulvibacterium marinum TaxID=2419782 RepID=A0A3B0C1T0_9FLAO|nr:L-rhamnose mutarotase [Ulvibacterium marinum]RKN78678.1 L-rhamnose mutarotase [Ulvibacterium marinum]
MVIRKAFKMKVYPDKIEEYAKRHNPIWPELEEKLKEHGVENYSIFLDAETNSLFGYAEVESEEKWNALAETAVCKKWWAHMTDLMETNNDNSPVSKDLESLFYMP